MISAFGLADPASGPHRITHLYLVDPKDRPRFAELGVVADFQIAPSSIDPAYVALHHLLRVMVIIIGAQFLIGWLIGGKTKKT